MAGFNFTQSCVSCIIPVHVHVVGGEKSGLLACHPKLTVGPSRLNPIVKLVRDSRLHVAMRAEKHIGSKYMHLLNRVTFGISSYHIPGAHSKSPPLHLIWLPMAPSLRLLKLCPFLKGQAWHHIASLGNSYF